MKNEIVLDVRELITPFPILRTEKLLRKMFPGQVLCIIASDSHSATEFQSYCDETGNKLVKCSESDDKYYYRIQKKR